MGFDESYSDAGPTKPTDITPNVSVVWDQLRTQIHPSILQAADAHQLRILAELIVQSKALSKDALANPHVLGLTRLWLSVADHLCRLSALFGLSPGDRSRLKIDSSESRNDPSQEWTKLS